MTNPDKLDIAALEAAERAATPGPWYYRPSPFDDWGWIRGPVPAGETDHPGWTVAQAKSGGETGLSESDHRRNGTDPYGPNAVLMVALRNAAPALIAAYRERDALKDALSASGIDVCYDPRTGKIDGFMQDVTEDFVNVAARDKQIAAMTAERDALKAERDMFKREAEKACVHLDLARKSRDALKAERDEAREDATDFVDRLRHASATIAGIRDGAEMLRAELDALRAHRDTMREALEKAQKAMKDAAQTLRQVPVDGGVGSIAWKDAVELEEACRATLAALSHNPETTP